MKKNRLEVLVLVALLLCCLAPLLTVLGALGAVAAVERPPWIAIVGAALLLSGAVALTLRFRARRP